MSKEIKELSPKYIVFKRKDYPEKIDFIFDDLELYDEYCKGEQKYFVMKLDDEFNVNEIRDVLRNSYPGKNYNYHNKIKGSELALIILNSISDKAKLKERRSENRKWVT